MGKSLKYIWKSLKSRSVLAHTISGPARCWYRKCKLRPNAKTNMTSHCAAPVECKNIWCKWNHWGWAFKKKSILRDFSCDLPLTHTLHTAVKLQRKKKRRDIHHCLTVTEAPAHQDHRPKTWCQWRESLATVAWSHLRTSRPWTHRSVVILVVEFEVSLV